MENASKLCESSNISPLRNFPPQGAAAMDPKPSATPTPCSTEVPSTGPQVNVRKTLKKMTGQPVDKSPNQHASSRKSAGKGEHSGTGTSRKRKRKKTSSAASAVPSHPSVLEAAACTKRQEQVEEARARETVYLAPKTESVASQVEETRETASNTESSSAGDTALAGSIPRARRPWEWSAKDCDAVLVDVLSRARPEGELMGEDTPASNCADVSLGQDSACRRKDIGSGGATSNGKVTEDERTAREVNAALNRNNPRVKSQRMLGGGAPQPNISGGKVRASSASQKAADDEKEARHLSALLNRNRPRRGLKSTRDGARPEGSDTNNVEEDPRAAGGEIWCDLGNSGCEAPTAVHASCTLNGGEGHLCASKGKALGKGSAVEVLWDDRKWYRCTLSSISAEGTHGVLEFLPYRRRNHSREFSSQLELEDWILAGKLVLPGTHLKWD